jgi:8-oxo-dGTP diphosphatase
MRKQVIAAGAFIFDPQGRLFLGKFASKFQQKWSIPGGKIDFGETPLEAVKREVKEETDLDIDEFTYFTQGAFVVDEVHVVYIDFMAHCPQDAKVATNHEFSQWGFFSAEEIAGLDIIPQTKSDALLAFSLLK